MGKKVLKYLFRGILILIGIAIIIFFALDLPPVQNFIKNKAVSYVSNNMGVRLSVDRLRLKFPLKLALSNTTVLTNDADTLFHCNALEADVKVIPLLGQNVVVKRFQADGLILDYTDGTTGMVLTGRLDSLSLKADRIDLKRDSIVVDFVTVYNGSVFLKTGTSVEDTTTNNSMWRIAGGSVNIRETRFRMADTEDNTVVNAYLRNGTIANALVDIPSALVRVESLRLDNGECIINTYPYVTTTTDDLTVSDAGQWVVSAGKIEINDTGFSYSNGTPPTSGGIDFNNLSLTDINADIDSAYYRGIEMGATINDINLKERNGLVIKRLETRASIDSTQINIDDLVLKTTNSNLTADAEIGNGISQSDPQAPVRAQITADVDIDEILSLFTIADQQIESSLKGKRLSAVVNISGLLGNLSVKRAYIKIPNELDASVGGTITNVTDAEHIGGNIRFMANITDGELLEKIILDTAARNRINIPPLSTEGTIAASNGVYSPDIKLIINGGNITVAGSYNTNVNDYNLNAEAHDFPIYRILPQDSLGTTSFTLMAEGEGFDIYNAGTTAAVDFELDSLEYSGYTYRKINVEAELKEHFLTGSIFSGSDALDMDLDVSGILMETDQQAEIHGEVRNLDLYRMNFSDKELDMSFFLDITAKASGTRVFDFYTEIDSLHIHESGKEVVLNHTELTIAADTTEVGLKINSGDMSLTLTAYGPLDSVISKVSGIADIVQQQIDRHDIDMTAVNTALPEFELGMTTGSNNIVGYFLNPANLGLRRMELHASKTNGHPFTLDLMTDYLTYNNLLFDTLSVGLATEEEKMKYDITLSNLRSGENSKAHIELYGSVYSDTVTLSAIHHDAQWKTGFDINTYATWGDSSAILHIIDRGLILNYDQWSVNTDNYISYGFSSGTLGANLRMSYENQLVAVETLDDSSINLEIENLDIGTTLSLLPSAPQMDGELSANLTAGFSPVFADGTISAKDLLYNKDTIGNIDIDLNYNNSSGSFDANINVNGSQVLVADGNLGTDSTGNLNITTRLDRLPLNLANPFIPDDYADLRGYLNGSFSVAGASGSTVVSGTATFEDAAVEVAAVGTEFDISDNTLSIENSVLTLNGFSIISPNNQTLDINGTVDFTNFSNILTDLSVTADNFQAVNVQRNRTSMVYGTAYIDLDATAKGPLNDLVVRGELDLLNNTDVTYVMQDNSLDIEEQAQDIVTFVSFSDTTYYALPDTTARLQLTGIDMLVNMNIEEGVKAALNLSTDGQNRIEVQGSGELTYATNQLGDTRFTGRYNLTGGTVNYNPPVISAKSFAIQDGSYVQWNGDIADPTVNISAVESLITNVTEKGESARRVDFNIIIKVQNTLENLEITFDLAAPNDLSIQNQLTAMTDEQRSTQAMNLLIYNTYSGPGTVAKGNATNPLNNFVERELNQWAQDNLKGVDLSFGIDQYRQATATGETTRTDYSYSLSKNLFNDRVRTVIGGRISTDSETDAALTDNFIDDISLEYLLNESGNMYVKVFRHTGYESILEGEVTQTGFGFVVSKKMNKLYELFHFGKKRKQRREQKREAAAAADNTDTESITEEYADEE
ncbi:MAG: translocation/assembly module TamB [Rikenellaceae bacterium]|nr:translocation/assembly module TamB [Rikenellaceae bacterium]